jgi:predicted DNA-binding ribbon-helix-helix protein
MTTSFCGKVNLCHSGTWGTIVTLPDVKYRGPSAVHVVRIGKQRTSVRLDHEFWTAFEEIANRENSSIHELCVLVDQRRGRYGLTAAIRTFILCYYRSQMHLANVQAMGTEVAPAAVLTPEPPNYLDA